MKATELRIGNLIDPDMVVGSMIERAKIGATGKYICVTADILKTEACTMMVGIPLTEEWLVTFGFHKSSNQYFSIASFSYIEHDAYGCNGGFGYCLHDERGIFLEIKYVHQLQNLYFALTGEELSIND